MNKFADGKVFCLRKFGNTGNEVRISKPNRSTEGILGEVFGKACGESFRIILGNDVAKFEVVLESRTFVNFTGGIY